MDAPVFRHEWKYPLNLAEIEVLRRKLGFVMQIDPHAIDGKYQIRSLYFDNFDDKALAEKVNGDYERSKFRIRIYNGDDSFISLEKKVKVGNLTQKFGARITREEYEKIVRGDIRWMLGDKRALLTELYYRMTTESMRPKTLVEYTRYPFVYEPGNVRITLDYNIRSGIFGTDLFSEQIMPFADAPNIVEVKYDHFLPDVIAGLVNYADHPRTALSKYAACRIFG